MRTAVPKMLTKVVDLTVQTVFDALVIEYGSAEYKAALVESTRTRKREAKNEDQTKTATSEEQHQIFLKDKRFLKYCVEKNRHPENIYFYRKASQLKRLEANFSAYTKRLNSIFLLFIPDGAPQQISIQDDLRKSLEMAHYLAPIMVRIRVKVVFKYKRKLRESMNTGPLESFRQHDNAEFLSSNWINTYAGFEEKWLNGSDLFHSLSKMEWLEDDFREYMIFYGGIATNVEADRLEFNDLDGQDFVEDAEKFFQLINEVVGAKNLSLELSRE